MKILAIHGSSRPKGNTEQLTRKALQGLDATHIHLSDFTIQPIDDLRHEPGGFQPIEDDNDHIVKLILDHDILVFSTPVYWYGMSGMMKDLIDRFSQNMRDTRYDFKDSLSKKKAYVICCGGDNPKIKALPLIQQFNYIFEFVSLEFAGYIIGQANKPGEVANDIQAIQQAGELNKILIRSN
ncbi:flavodoxin family protein [Alkalihalobacillus sp. TS-13]|uniref:flavodoxin family protein n=1 Tax=Alkalihalobacillus sp. TS-13 TaxID=2842455 RepID=UPI001C88DDFA|nr:NAD(P)H-dependent oxidoreductase [Alkalihalobacillus sp. TS-13]